MRMVVTLAGVLFMALGGGQALCATTTSTATVNPPAPVPGSGAVGAEPAASAARPPGGQQPPGHGSADSNTHPVVAATHRGGSSHGAQAAGGAPHAVGDGREAPASTADSAAVAEGANATSTTGTGSSVGGEGAATDTSGGPPSGGPTEAAPPQKSSNDFAVPALAILGLWTLILTALMVWLIFGLAKEFKQLRLSIDHEIAFSDALEKRLKSLESVASTPSPDVGRWQSYIMTRLSDLETTIQNREIEPSDFGRTLNRPPISPPLRRADPVPLADIRRPEFRPSVEPIVQNRRPMRTIDVQDVCNLYNKLVADPTAAAIGEFRSNFSVIPVVKEGDRLTEGENDLLWFIPVSADETQGLFTPGAKVITNWKKNYKALNGETAKNNLGFAFTLAPGDNLRILTPARGTYKDPNFEVTDKGDLQGIDGART